MNQTISTTSFWRAWAARRERSAVRQISAAMISLLVMIGGRPAAAGLLFNYVDLGTLGGSNSFAYAINNAGQIAGQSQTTTSGGAYNATVWSGGKAMNLQPSSGAGNSTRAYAINNAGVVVGESNNPVYQLEIATVWNNGSTMQLGVAPLFEFSHAYGVNDAGQVVGSASTPYTEGYVYTSGTATFMTLPGNFGSSDSLAINNLGQVVGYSGATGGTIHAFVWQSGAITDLGTLGGNVSAALAINNSGQIVGYSNIVANSSNFACLWSGGTITQLSMLPGSSFSNAAGINDAGEIVGASGTDAVMWVGGNVYDLNNALVS